MFGNACANPCVARELDDPVLAIQIRREVLAEVVEPILRRLQHRRQRERVLRNVVDLQLDAVVLGRA